jgi:hypothetical protein
MVCCCMKIWALGSFLIAINGGPYRHGELHMGSLILASCYAMQNVTDDADGRCRKERKK